MHLTEAGERLYASVRPALDEVRAAVAAVGELGDQARGTLRVHTSSAAETLIGESLLAGFLTEHPHVQLDLVVSDAPVDVVAQGFDAGIQLGEVIDKDMIAVAVTGDLRLAVVGAPYYFARRDVPAHPRDLVEHECLNWHPTADHVRDALERGELVRVLEKFCEPFPGYYLYYPQRRHASRALRALIDHLRRWRQARRKRKRGVPFH